MIYMLYTMAAVSLIQSDTRWKRQMQDNSWVPNHVADVLIILSLLYFFWFLLEWALALVGISSDCLSGMISHYYAGKQPILWGFWLTSDMCISTGMGVPGRGHKKRAV